MKYREFLSVAAHNLNPTGFPSTTQWFLKIELEMSFHTALSLSLMMALKASVKWILL